MKNKVLALGTFILGAAIGSVTTYVVQKKQFEKEKDILYEKEIGPARENYMAKIKELIDLNRVKKEKIDEVDDLNKDLGYVQDFPNGDEIQVLNNDFPSVYLISSQEFDESDYYPKKELVYYANGVLVDEDFDVINDIESVISKDVYNSFEEHLKNAEDIVWVRNEDISVDFEVQLADYDFND